MHDFDFNLDGRLDFGIPLFKLCGSDPFNYDIELSLRLLKSLFIEKRIFFISQEESDLNINGYGYDFLWKANWKQIEERIRKKYFNFIKENKDKSLSSFFLYENFEIAWIDEKSKKIMIDWEWIEKSQA